MEVLLTLPEVEELPILPLGGGGVMQPVIPKT